MHSLHKAHKTNTQLKGWVHLQVSSSRTKQTLMHVGTGDLQIYFWSYLSNIICTLYATQTEVYQFYQKLLIGQNSGTPHKCRVHHSLYRGKIISCSYIL